MKRSNEFDCEITEYERTNPVRHVQKYAEYSGIIQENSAAYAQHLFEQGYVVFPTAYTGDLRNDLETEFLKMPEFKQHLKFSELNTTQGYICGATSFTSNPSVFHNATSRKYRQQTTASLMPIFQKFVKLHGCPNLKLRTGSDRIQVRGKGRKPGAEGWHRDINPSGRRGECSIGGWGNADDTNQYFCGIKGTHSLEVQDKKGFASIKGPEIEKYKAMMLSQVGTRNALGIVDTDSKGKIIIPPNHSILFFANMVHAVNPTKAEKTSVKQFNGYTITPFDDSGMVKHVDKKTKLPVLFTFDELDTKMNTNDVLVLCSGQIPPMYPATYQLYRDKQLPIFKKFQTDMLVDDAMKYPLYDARGELLLDMTGKLLHHRAHSDETRSMKSLAALGLPLHPAYTREELDMTRPRDEIPIFNHETGEIEMHFLYA